MKLFLVHFHVSFTFGSFIYFFFMWWEKLSTKHTTSGFNNRDKTYYTPAEPEYEQLRFRTSITYGDDPSNNWDENSFHKICNLWGRMHYASFRRGEDVLEKLMFLVKLKIKKRKSWMKANLATNSSKFCEKLLFLKKNIKNPFFFK